MAVPVIMQLFPEQGHKSLNGRGTSDGMLSKDVIQRKNSGFSVV